MNWDAIGAIGELLGAAAVLATLIYLALQIRQNTAATRAQIHQSRSDQALEFFLFGAGSSELMDILEKVYDSDDDVPDISKLDDLTWTEKRRLLFYSVANQQRLENMFFQYKNGFLEEQTYRRTLAPTSRQIPLWEALGIMRFTEGDFAEEIERIRREEGT